MEKLDSCLLCGNELSDDQIVPDYFLTGEAFTLQHCEKCNFLCTNPRPSFEESSKYYESQKYLSHDASQKGLFPFLYRIARIWMLGIKFGIIKRVVERGGSILDIGCGTGDFLKFCEEQGLEGQGIEPNLQAREIAMNSRGVKVVSVEEMNSLPLSKYDVITMWHVLEHIHDLHAQIDYIKSRLKTGGFLVLALPNHDSFDAKYYGSYWAGYDVPRHLYHFNKGSIQSLMEEKGFSLTQEHPMLLDAFYVSLLSEGYKGKRKINAYIRAFVVGCLSNLKAFINVGNQYSSKIYVYKQK